MMSKANHITIVLLFAVCLSCSDDRAQTRGHSDAGYAAPKKIPVYRENVYDLIGYADEGAGDPYSLFDENERVDPANDPGAAYKPHTNPLPTQHQDIYFPPGKGNRIVIDLQTNCRLTDAYLYDRSNSADSVWIYTGDMLHWKKKAAFTTVAFFESAHWRKFALNDSSRYVMIRFSSPRTAVTEMVLYGYPSGTVPHPPVYAARPPAFTQTTMKEFLGNNDYNSIEPQWLKPFYYTRLYANALDFDHDTTHSYPGVQFNMTHFGFFDNSRNDYNYGPEDNVRENHHVIWYSMMGLPYWMARDEKDKKNRPVTQWGMDPEDPKSYARHAALMWTLAAWFGHVRVDTKLISVDHEPKSSGRGTMRLYENGNEEDGFWKGEAYCNPVAYFAQSNADFDGAERALGDKCGIINADSGSALITSGLIGLDTNRIKVYKFLCNTLRKDKAFIWKGGIQYHHYSTTLKHGITPEEDSMRWKLARVSDFTHRLEPGVPCILGENGYDKSQSTWQSTPLLPGLSPEECQAIFILRSINATAFSGFDSYILYWLRDNNPTDDPNVYMTSGVLRWWPEGRVRPYPSWFYISAFENRLANYRPDAIVSEKGRVWIYKYRNAQSPDSVAYFVYAPSHNGTVVPDFALPVGGTASDAMEVDFGAASAEGIGSVRKVAEGVVRMRVEERPKMILVRESGK